MYWSLQKPEENIAPEASPLASAEGEADLVNEASNLAIDDTAETAEDADTAEGAEAASENASS